MDFVCKNIRIVREIKGFSQEYMSMKLHISQSAYAKIERGETRLTVQRLHTICSILDIDMAQLFKENRIIERLQNKSRQPGTDAPAAPVRYQENAEPIRDEVLLLREERQLLLRILDQLSHTTLPMHN